MMPTLQVDDRLVASMRGPGALQRGDVILFDVGNAIYIQRLAALPGDRIEIIGGVVFLNGTQVPQTVVAQETAVNSQGEPSRRLFEQFPGEARAHQILDSGPARFDDMPEQLVPPGHVFVLGDNRDHSADSRMPRDEMGVGLLPISDIRGRALFYLWGPSGRMGEPLTP
jgi:signal peptidase I